MLTNGIPSLSTAWSQMRKMPSTFIFDVSPDHSHWQTPIPASMHFPEVFPSHCLSWSLLVQNACSLYPLWFILFLFFHHVQDRFYDAHHEIHGPFSSFFWFPSYYCDKVIWPKVTKSLRCLRHSALLRAQVSTESINRGEMLFASLLTGSLSLVFKISSLNISYIIFWS